VGARAEIVGSISTSKYRSFLDQLITKQNHKAFLIGFEVFTFSLSNFRKVNEWYTEISSDRRARSTVVKLLKFKFCVEGLGEFV
jgi:hypothetical protein